jgi:hypothetical protein
LYVTFCTPVAGAIRTLAVNTFVGVFGGLTGAVGVLG